MSVDVPRPIDPSLHPLATGNYRIATPAIQAFYDLVIPRRSVKFPHVWSPQNPPGNDRRLSGP
jgi:hypothetical protein